MDGCEPDGAPEPEGDGGPERAARDKMVATIAAEVTETSRWLDKDRLDPRVMSAMAKVPRAHFVPLGQQAAAYDNRPLPIGHGQTISQPLIVAVMTHLLQIEPDARILEIGTGSGYDAALLSRMVRKVYTIEIDRELGSRAESTLRDLGYRNVKVRIGDGYRGWPEEAPFDAICVTAAPDHIPQPLIDQLAIGGRLIVPVGDEIQELILLRKTKAGIERASVLPVRFVPMTGIAEEEDG